MSLWSYRDLSEMVPAVRLHAGDREFDSRMPGGRVEDCDLEVVLPGRHVRREKQRGIVEIISGKPLADVGAGNQGFDVRCSLQAQREQEPAVARCDTGTCQQE